MTDLIWSFEGEPPASCCPEGGDTSEPFTPLHTNYNREFKYTWGNLYLHEEIKGVHKITVCLYTIHSSFFFIPPFS